MGQQALLGGHSEFPDSSQGVMVPAGFPGWAWDVEVT